MFFTKAYKAASGFVNRNKTVELLNEIQPLDTGLGNCRGINMKVRWLEGREQNIVERLKGGTLAKVVKKMRK